MSELVDLFGAYKLGAPLAVSEECLGNDFPVRLGNHDGRLSLPQLDWREDRPILVAPPADRALRERVEHSIENEAWDYWGLSSKWNPHDRTIDGAFVAALWLTFSVPAEEIEYSEYLGGPRGQPRGDPVKELFHAIDGWFEILRTWTEVLADQDLLADGQVRVGETPGEGLTLLTHDALGVSLPSHPNEMSIILREVEELSLNQLQRVLHGASNGLRPSDAQLLIRDARSELRRGRHRRAVIDAGTAVELTLAAFNARVTKAKPSRGRFPTLGWYVKCKAIVKAAAIPKATDHDLVKPRNNAVHENQVPTPTQTLAAIKVASEIVGRLDPPAI